MILSQMRKCAIEYLYLAILFNVMPSISINIAANDLNTPVCSVCMCLYTHRIFLLYFNGHLG